ncbi:MAG: ABC transporter permease [Rhodoluna sp.]|nr:ABC transporter permease [Rhodoluna sp.]
MSEKLSLNTGHEGTTRDQLSSYISRLKAGDMGPLPAVGAAILLMALFSFLSNVFLTPINLTNLLVQSATLIMLTSALVFVILLAEIDLSAGVTFGTGMAIFVKLNQSSPNTWILNLLLAFVFGVAVGWFMGFFVAKIGVPSFVISLALYLAFPGVMLIILGEGGILTLQVPEVMAIMNGTMPLWAGWLLLVICLAVTAAMSLWDRSRRIKANLPVRPLPLLAMKLGGMAIIGAVVVQICNIDRRQGGLLSSSSPDYHPIQGMPIVVPFVVVILFICTFMLDRTRYGRHLYAVGGNPEAARRAGIKVAKIRMTAFIICSTLAMIAGVFNVSRIGNVESGAGKSIVLEGVAAAVVGGVSLFGGRGRLAYAALGAFVISTIDNGLGLLGVPAGLNFIITGGVLLIAATIDALARKRAGGTLLR